MKFWSRYLAVLASLEALQLDARDADTLDIHYRSVESGTYAADPMLLAFRQQDYGQDYIELY